MYEQFYGLTEKPFSLTPNPRFVFQSEQYRAAEESLLYGVGQKEGFMLVTGAPGTGKTTLCRDLLEKLDPQKYRVALIFNPFLNGVEMLHALLSEFGLGDHSANTSRKELLDRLNQFLLQQLAGGRTCIAIFDEAQHLSTEFLEQIRVLSNLETDREKLIQIILVGQPELLTLIRTPQMAQLDQRVSVRCTLTHLNRDEVSRYLYHRLNVAGAQGRIKFQEPAVRLIHASTSGVPRLVNLAADRALLAAYAEQARSISDVHVRQGLASVRGEDGIDDKAVAQPQLLKGPRAPRWPWLVAGTAVAAALLAVLLWWRLDGTAGLLAVQAARASSTTEAEETYARIAAMRTRSRQRETALLRLAQLQIARGANAEALGWLETLDRDYPADSTSSDRRYWLTRALLGTGDTTRACATVRSVRSASSERLAADFAALGTECLAFQARMDAANADSTRAVRGTSSDSVAAPPLAGAPAAEATP
jgi:type II secretory pathway predicted ATPase ExeA